MLISILFPFLFINICAVLLAAVADVRFSRTVPVIVMSIMAFIYPFYALDVLRAGKIALAVVLCLLSVGLAAFCVVKKNPADRVKRINVRSIRNDVSLKTLKPEKLEIKDDAKNTAICIIYKRIETL